MGYTCKNQGQLVKKQADGQTDTTDFITFLANAVGKKGAGRSAESIGTGTVTGL